MSFSVGQVTTNTSTATVIGVLAPGASVTLQTTGGNPNYVGLGTGVTSSNGFPFLTGANSLPVTWQLAYTAAAVTLYAISTTGASTIGYCFSDAS